jgi:tRNA(Phe) wybutosine-synthesizing methylase Tyw3
VLHTSCASLAAAQALLQVALQCGFKNSGIMLGQKVRRRLFPGRRAAR